MMPKSVSACVGFDRFMSNDAVWPDGGTGTPSVLSDTSVLTVVSLRLCGTRRRHILSSDWETWQAAPHCVGVSVQVIWIFFALFTRLGC